MKKKIAVFSNAWGAKSLSDSLEGIMESAKRYDTDVFLFVSYAALGNKEEDRHEEIRIYDLPDIEDFDGIII